MCLTYLSPFPHGFNSKNKAKSERESLDYWRVPAEKSSLIYIYILLLIISLLLVALLLVWLFVVLSWLLLVLVLLLVVWWLYYIILYYIILYYILYYVIYYIILYIILYYILLYCIVLYYIIIIIIIYHKFHNIWIYLEHPHKEQGYLATPPRRSTSLPGAAAQPGPPWAHWARRAVPTLGRKRWEITVVKYYIMWKLYGLYCGFIMDLLWKCYGLYGNII